MPPISQQHNLLLGIRIRLVNIFVKVVNAPQTRLARRLHVFLATRLFRLFRLRLL